MNLTEKASTTGLNQSSQSQTNDNERVGMMGTRMHKSLVTLGMFAAVFATVTLTSTAAQAEEGTIVAGEESAVAIEQSDATDFAVEGNAELTLVSADELDESDAPAESLGADLVIEGDACTAGEGGEAGIDSYWSYPIQTWTADRYGYTRSDFHRGEPMSVYFTVYNRSRCYTTVPVAIRNVKPAPMCIMIFPLPPGCRQMVQTLHFGYHSFPPGVSRWRLDTQISYYANPGERAIRVEVDGDVAGSNFRIW